MKYMMRNLYKRMLFNICYLFALVIIPIKYRRSYKDGELSYLSHDDYIIWKNAMLKMLKSYCLDGYNLRVHQIISTFSDAKIEIVRKSEVPEINIPIVVLCVKNDLQRLQMLVDHYRSLGVLRFAFLDNGSNDGTYEWCLKQNDIDLYRCLQQYKTLVKEGWINRIVSYYGFNRWYILTDSDELMVYKGMETHPLADLVRYAEKHGIKRIKGLTLDTYSDKKLFGHVDNIRNSYRWIDIDSYRSVETLRGNRIIKRMIGGPRYRLMGSSITLSKFPLVYFEPGMLSDSAHSQFPHIGNCSCNVGILHYKFIDKDLEEYRNRASRKSGFSGSGKFYKQYLEYVSNNTNATFMYEGSREFTSSEVLDKIDKIDKIDL